MKQGSDRPFLVCYDYGMGGLWWWIEAVSAESITAKYKDVTVFEDVPDWWHSEIDQATPRRLLGDPSDEALARLERRNFV